MIQRQYFQGFLDCLGKSSSRFLFRMSTEANNKGKGGEGEVTRAAGVVGFFTLLSRILGLVRDMVLATLFGAGLVADAFFVAFRIPNLLRRLFAEGSLTISFIPVFTEYLEQRGKKEAMELARVALTLLTIVLTVVAMAGVVFAPWIVRIQAWGFGSAGTKYELTVLLTRITFPYIFFVSLVAFFMGVLNSLKKFAPPAAAPIFLNVGIIGAAYLISPHLSQPIVGVAVGVIIGGVFQLLLQLPWALKEGMRFLPKWEPLNPGLKRIGLLMLPAVFGSAVYQLNQFIGTLLASFLPEGSISWLYYADRLVQFPLGVFAIAISTAALPSLSTYAARNDSARFSQTLTHALGLVFFISLPSLVGLMVLGEPIVRLLFERGAFRPEHTAMTTLALLYYCLGLWAFSGIRVMVAAFYAVQDTKTPVMVAAFALVLNLILSLILMGPMKHAGLALSLSLASSVQFFLLLALFKKRTGTEFSSIIMGSALKSLFSSLSMGAVLYLATLMWQMPPASSGAVAVAVRVLLLVFLGAGVYLGASKLVGSAELNSIKAFLPRGPRS